MGLGVRRGGGAGGVEDLTVGERCSVGVGLETIPPNAVNTAVLGSRRILCARCRKGMSMKDKKSAWDLFAVVCFGLGVLVGCKSIGRSMDAAKPTSEVKPLFKPEVASLAQQKMCDEQAGKKFREYGPGKTDYYTSHYDPTVNVCYVRIHSFSYEPPAIIGEVIYDAFGGREFASYSWIYDKNKLPSEVSPMECAIHVPGKPEEKCKTREEFDELTEKYFGVAK